MVFVLEILSVGSKSIRGYSHANMITWAQFRAPAFFLKRKLMIAQLDKKYPLPLLLAGSLPHPQEFATEPCSEPHDSLSILNPLSYNYMKQSAS
jgi:hypothetical protein